MKQTTNYLKLFLLMLLCPAGIAGAQTVSTFAGTGTAGFNFGGSEPISTAKFYNPYGIAIDSAGNIWVSEGSNSERLSLISGGNVYTRIGFNGDPTSGTGSGFKDGTGAGNGVGQPSKISNTGHLVIAPDGTIFLADRGNHAIRRISKFSSVGSAQVMSTPFGALPVNNQGTPGDTDATGNDARFDGPTGIAIDDAGANLYVTDNNSHTIRKIVIATGVVTTIAGNAGVSGSTDAVGTAATFNFPEGIDYFNNALYVADYANRKIRKINLSTMAVTTIAGGGVDPVPGADGDITLAKLRGPRDVAVDANGNVFFTDGSNAHRVRKVVGTTISTVAGLHDSPGFKDGQDTAARFSIPAGIAFDKSRTVLYVVDEGVVGTPAVNNHSIRKIVLGPGADFSADILNPTVGQKVTFTDLSINKPATYTWAVSPGTAGNEWDFSDLTNTNSPNPKIEFNDPGTYSVTLTVTNPYGSDAETKTNYIIVSGGGSAGKPVAKFMATKTTAYFTDTVTLVDQSDSVPNIWAWTITPTTFTFVDGTSAVSQHPKVQFNATGFYTVTLIATNASGSDTATKVDYIAVFNVGVKEAAENGIMNIWPNPSDGAVNISLPGNSVASSLEISDLMGRVVYSKQAITATEVNLDLNSLEKGVYIVRVNANNSSSTRKLILK
jgi:PKD repeat protein